MLPQLFSTQSVQGTVAFVLFVGTNDSAPRELGPEIHVPIDEYQQNLKDIVKYMENVGVSKDKVILIGSPPCDETEMKKYSEETGESMPYTNESVGEYAQACGVVAKELGVDYIDLYETMTGEEDWSRFLNDGLHLSAEGSCLMFSLLKPLIDERTRDLHPIMPLWNEIKHEDPQKSLLL